ncbi:exo-alpha-sialidase [Luteibacter aegosomaticola]|uniref:exo-alpha-sialidase n=1 Tax=Luteibacter aegosomaticola TaxID=2911538 RepID=UPI001FFA0280|nr:exo-alpha-sialidase [Luteibacter aegosomaticola]UPG91186.1 exo-alpha-sialidase [Luteibacter aegosomaticola]
MMSFKRHALALALLSVTTGACAAPAMPEVVGTHLADGSGYVTVTPIGEGTDRLLMAFEQKGMAGIALWRSDDGGDHWQSVGNVTDQVHKDPAWQLRWQPHLMRMPRASGGLPAGTLILSANATGNNAEGRVSSEDLQVYASTDQGATWHYRGSVIRGGGKPEDKDNKGVWETNIHILDDGRMVAYYSTEQHKAEGYNQALGHKLSTDGGKTWGNEVLDVAIPGGVERPGMAVVTRLGDGRYAMTYENIDGPNNGQVHIKFSRDGLDWGDPQRHGLPVATASGAWPSACPVVQWFPIGGPEGTLVISAERAGGGGDEGGRSLYWNNASGRGPWWEAPAPVQKRTGNIHAGWTQALIRRADGRFLHVTTSSSPTEPTSEWANEVLYQSAALDFERFEAEDAAREGSVAIPDPKASNGRKARLGAGRDGRLTFDVNTGAGERTLRVRFQTVGLPGVPALAVNGARQPAGTVRDDHDGWSMLETRVKLLPGSNTIDIDGGAHVLDIDFLQVSP